MLCIPSELRLEGMKGVNKVKMSEMHECPPGSLVDGFDLAYYPLLGMTAISAECADKHGNTVG